MKAETKCKYCGSETDKPCVLANFTTEIDGKTYTFCCQNCATKFKTERAKEE